MNSSLKKDTTRLIFLPQGIRFKAKMILRGYFFVVSKSKTWTNFLKTLTNMQKHKPVLIRNKRENDVF